MVPATKITLIPNSPAFLLGLAAVRGKVLGVIDASKRYGLPNSLNGYFLVCMVRGNLTAISIDQPIFAGQLYVRELPDSEKEKLRAKFSMDPKFVNGAYEIFQTTDDAGATQSSGIYTLSVEPDLFVSAEMASKVGEAA